MGMVAQCSVWLCGQVQVIPRKPLVLQVISIFSYFGHWLTTDAMVSWEETGGGGDPGVGGARLLTTS